MKQHLSRGLLALVGFVAGATSACNSITGLDDFTVKSGDDTATPACTTNQKCTELATAANNGTEVQAVCVKDPEPHCVNLLSEDCMTVTGDPLDGDPIILGTLFTTTGAQATTNLQRQKSAQLAIEQINKVGGVPSATAGEGRKLVLVSCDESTMLRAAEHLVDELHVPGIVGPNTSQDTLDLSNKYTIKGSTVVMTPTGVASSITGLLDNDLTWQMVPTDVQRAPLMINQINEIETKLKADRGLSTVKLGIIFRDDALGSGTRTALNSLTLNGKPISDTSVNLTKNVLIDGYDFSKPDQAAIVSKYVEFAPDIVVLAGTAEAISQVMKPLEAAWKAPNRPQYVLIDSVKVPDLITLATNNMDGLQGRVRGTGIKTSPESSSVLQAFQVDYQLEFNESATTSGMGPSYDAAFSLAYALAATHDQPVSGDEIAKGLRMLAGGTTQFNVGALQVTQAFQKLAAGEKIKGMGTFGPLEWDANGAVVGGTLEMWCIGGSTSTPAYKSSGLTFDIRTQQPSGQYTQCAP